MILEKSFDVLILGAGINGLSTAYHLSSHPQLKIGMVEQFSLGNSFGGSHGASRIIRSTYSHPMYINLVQRALKHDWVALEKEMGRALIYPNSACYFGSGKSYETYVQAMVNSGLAIDVLEASVASRLYPQFRFQKGTTVLHDQTGGVIAAKETMDGLALLIAKKRVKIYEQTKVLEIDNSQTPIRVVTDRGELFTERLVITVGAWMNKLLPDLNPIVTPIRQTVAYFKLKGPKANYQVGTFPNWAFVGDKPNEVFYGLPEFGSEGIKVSQHMTVGSPDNPDVKSAVVDPKQVEVLRHFVQEHFVPSIERLVHSETCFYANTPNEDFLIDRLPADHRIVIGSACSGHGFKFAPLLGKVLAELVLEGKTTIPEFEEAKHAFSLNRSR